MPQEQEQFDLASAQAGLHAAREALDATHVRFAAPRPCKDCGCETLTVVKDGIHYRGTCEQCGTFVKFVAKADLGEKPATVASLRRDIRPGKAQRILDRDHGRCIFCGRTEDLTVDLFIRPQHLLSLKEGHRLGFSAEELNHEANLAAMCDACNLGLQGRSVSLSTVQVKLHLGLLRAEIDRRHQQGA